MRNLTTIFSFSGASQESAWLWVSSQRRWTEAGGSGAPGLTAPGPAGLEFSLQRGNVTTLSKTFFIKPSSQFMGMFFHNRWHPETDHMVDSKRATVSSTDRSLGASTALGRGSGIGHVTQNPVRIIHRPSERCCAANLTLCPITMSSTHGFLWLTHVRSQRLRYTISTDGHRC